MRGLTAEETVFLIEGVFRGILPFHSRADKGVIPQLTVLALGVHLVDILVTLVRVTVNKARVLPSVWVIHPYCVPLVFFDKRLATDVTISCTVEVVPVRPCHLEFSLVQQLFSDFTFQQL